jgi:hypothetical protein
MNVYISSKIYWRYIGFPLSLGPILFKEWSENSSNNISIRYLEKNEKINEKQIKLFDFKQGSSVYTDTGTIISNLYNDDIIIHASMAGRYHMIILKHPEDFSPFSLQSLCLYKYMEFLIE